MFELDHVRVSASDLRSTALHLQRLGFTLSRGDAPDHLRIVLADGYLDLRQEPVAGPRWSRYYLRIPDLEVAAWALRERGLNPGELLPVPGPEPGGNPVAHEAALQDPAEPGVLPWLIQPAGGLRPQDRMEPERARAVTTHANTATTLGGVMVLVPETEPVVALYEQLLGRRADAGIRDHALGVEGQSLTVGEGKAVSIVSATYGTGPADWFRNEFRAGLFAVVIRVQSLPAAAEALRNAGVYSFFHEGALITSAALPGFGLLVLAQEGAE